MGDSVEPDFSWVVFFQEFAEKIYENKDNYERFSETIKNIAEETLPKKKGKERAMPTYINPFSAFAIINRAIKTQTRIELCRAYKEKFDMKSEIPSGFDGVPVANNVNWWYILEHSDYGQKLPDKKITDDNNRIWADFCKLYECFKLNKDDERAFIDAFDDLKEIDRIGLTYVTIALFWMDPDDYVPLDSKTMQYLRKKIKIEIPRSIDRYFRSTNRARKTSKVGEDYLLLINDLKNKGGVSDFKELSYKAWVDSSSTVEPADEVSLDQWNQVFDAGLITDDVRRIIETTSEQDDSQMDIKEIEIQTRLEGITKTIEVCGKGVRDYLKINANSWGGCVFFNSFGKKSARSISISESLAEYLAVAENQNKGGKDMNENRRYQPNLILYGPPGTGKTYNTRKEAVEIIEGHDCSDNDVKMKYEQYVKDGRIGFVTFHQSYSYEQFIEGITPITDDDQPDSLQYRVEDGVFKTFCENASFTGKYDIPDDPVVWKVSLQKTGENPLRSYCLENDCIRIGWNEYGQEIEDFSNLKDGKRELTNFYNMKKGDYVFSCYSNTTIDAVGMIIDDEPEWSPLEDKRYCHYSRKRSVEWIKKFDNQKRDIYKINRNKVMAPSTVYRLWNISKSSLSDVLNEGEEEREPNKDKYVFIIDEINRGNVSRIFGELITLLENTKREGCEEELRAILPYSGDDFSVP